MIRTARRVTREGTSMRGLPPSAVRVGDKAACMEETAIGTASARGEAERRAARTCARMRERNLGRGTERGQGRRFVLTRTSSSRMECRE